MSDPTTKSVEEYLAKRIEGGYLDYAAVVTKYPEMKIEIDRILIEDGYSHLIVE